MDGIPEGPQHIQALRCATCNKSIPATAFAAGSEVVIEGAGENLTVYCNSDCKAGTPRQEFKKPLAATCMFSDCWERLDVNRLEEYPTDETGTFRYCSQKCRDADFRVTNASD